MFESLTSKLDAVLKKFKGRGILTEKDLDEGLREVRLALLEADVNFRVARELIDRIRQRAAGNAVLESLSPPPPAVQTNP